MASLTRLRSSRGTRRRFSSESEVLVERWTEVDGVEVFYRESPDRHDGPAMVHLHGFGMSGSYLVPTAERLADEFHTLVPDLPGFGRSGNAKEPLDLPDLAHATAHFLDDRGVERATLVGNSMGCAIITEFAHLHPDRIERAVLVAPAGGTHNQPFRTALRQLVLDGPREPPGLMPVALPDYVRFGVPSTMQLFHALSEYPSMERLLELHVPTLAVVGDRDPLMPAPDHLKGVAGRTENHAILVVIEGAAHAVNFSHPDELAHVIRQFMNDERIIDDPDAPGVARTYELHRGTLPPPIGG